jgi:hypothetical protein
MAEGCDIGVLYWIALIFPVSTVLVCWVIFYSIHYSASGRLPTVSDAIVGFPENVVFSVAMHIEIILIVILYLIRNHIITHFAQRQDLKAKSYRIKRRILRALTGIVPVGLSTMSINTLRDNGALHLSGAFLFWLGSDIYYIVSDSCLADVGHPVTRRWVSWTCLALAALCYGAVVAGHNLGVLQRFGLSIHDVGRAQLWLANAASAVQYCAALLVFVKLWHFGREVPRQVLMTMPVGGKAATD